MTSFRFFLVLFVFVLFCSLASKVQLVYHRGIERIDTLLACAAASGRCHIERSIIAESVALIFMQLCACCACFLNASLTLRHLTGKK